MVKDTIELASDPILQVEFKGENSHYGPFSLTSVSDEHFILHDFSKKSIHLLDKKGYVKDLIYEDLHGEFSSVIQVVSFEGKLALLVDKGDRILIFDRYFQFLNEVKLQERCKSFSTVESGIIVRPVDPIGAEGHFILKIYGWDGSSEILRAPTLPIKIPVDEYNFKKHEAGFVSYKETFNDCIYRLMPEGTDSSICFDFGEYTPSANLLSEDDLNFQRAHVQGFFRIIDYDFYEDIHTTILSFEQVDMTPRYFASITNFKTGQNKIYAFDPRQVPLPHNVSGKTIVLDFDLLFNEQIFRIYQIDLSKS